MTKIKDTQRTKSVHDIAAEYYAAYEYHSNLLRTWLVAYGIGGPVVLLANADLWAKLAASGSARCVGGLFLTGVALQVLLAALNKAIMWGKYYGEGHKEFRKDTIYQVADWLAGQFWIDLLVDVVSISLMVVATWQVFKLI